MPTSITSLEPVNVAIDGTWVVMRWVDANPTIDSVHFYIEGSGYEQFVSSDIASKTFVVKGGSRYRISLKVAGISASTGYLDMPAALPAPVPPPPVSVPFGDVPEGTRAGIVTVSPEFVFQGGKWVAV